MKTSIENIAAVVAAAIWADGVYDPAEKITVEEIAEALELDEKAFKAAVDKQVKALEKMSENQANAALKDAAEAVDDEEIGIVFEAAMQMLLADSELSRAEVSNLLVIAEALGIEDEDAILMLADMVKTEPDLTINMED
jgi:DnaJ-domain-containing protein 1